MGANRNWESESAWIWAAAVYFWSRLWWACLGEQSTKPASVRPKKKNQASQRAEEIGGMLFFFLESSIGGVGWVALEGCGRVLFVWTTRALYWANAFNQVKIRILNITRIKSISSYHFIKNFLLIFFPIRPKRRYLVTLFFRNHPNSDRHE
jgi:hypothetical protein